MRLAHGRQASRLVAAALLAFAQVSGAISAPPVREDNAAPHDWYHIVKIDARTYALSEPKYWQRNVSYLILGSKQALLFDTGPGIYSIRDETLLFYEFSPVFLESFAITGRQWTSVDVYGSGMAGHQIIGLGV
jgi:hypothetical protein